MKAKMEQLPAINPNPALSVRKDGTVLYSNKSGESLLDEWSVRVGEKLPSRIGDLVQRVISRNSPEKLEFKVGRRVYLIVFHPLPKEECVNISGFDISDQKKLENKHLEYEEKHCNIIEVANEGILIFDAEAKTTYANEKMVEMLGYSQEEIIGKFVWDFIDEEGKAIFELNMKNRQQIINEVYEFKLICKDGSSLWALISAGFFFNNDGKFTGSLGMFTNITERKQAKDVLCKNEQRVRLKLENVQPPVQKRTSLELTEIVDIHAIQSLMDDFYKLAQIPMSLNDLKGNVLVSAGWQDICTRFHRVHPETCQRCARSDTELSTGVFPGKFKLYKCENNMWDIVTPVMIEGQHVGNIFSGQFFLENEPLDYEFFRSQATRYGFNEEEYLAALEKVPRLSREAVDTGMSFLMMFANMFSQLSYGNIKLAHSLSEREP